MVHIAKIVGTGARAWARSAGDCSNLKLIILDGDGVDCRTIKLRRRAALQNDLVGSLSHRADIRVLEGGDPSIDREGI